MKHMKKHHHSDPMVGGTSDHESKPWGHGNYANMPQEVRMQEYPKRPYKDLDSIDDTAGRIETDDRHAERGERHNLDRGMY
jgi:hypothetical protein